MRILLDTNAYSHLKRGHSQVAALVRMSEEIFLSAIVIGELLYGFRQGSRASSEISESFSRSSTAPMSRSYPQLA